VIAGCDGFDPRQPTTYAVPGYTDNLTSDFKGRKIGIVKEGFGHPTSEADVDSLVLTAAKSMEQVGAIVEEVSIPMHLDGPVLFDVIAMEGLTETMFKGHG
jgi:amidase